MRHLLSPLAFWTTATFACLAFTAQAVINTDWDTFIPWAALTAVSTDAAANALRSTGKNGAQ